MNPAAELAGVTLRDNADPIHSIHGGPSSYPDNCAGSKNTLWIISYEECNFVNYSLLHSI